MQNIKAILEKSNKIAIFGHANPDGDAIWGMFAIGELLKNKKISYFTPDQPAKVFENVPGISRIKTEFDYKDYDLLIFIDFTEYSRIAKFTNQHWQYFDQNKLLIIDHHQGKTKSTTEYSIKDAKAMSACDIIFELINQFRHDKINKKIANYLYLWIATDTGNFMRWSSKDSIRSMQNAIELLKLWADKQRVVKEIFNKQSLQWLKFIETLIRRTQVDGNILYSYYDVKELAKHDTDKEQVKFAFETILKKVHGPKLYLLLRKDNNKMARWSLRSDNEVDCNKLAKKLFGGGGHKNAAGFGVPIRKTFTKTKSTILKKIQNYLKKN